MRIFVINLHRSFDRRATISRALASCSIDFEFFPAIDGAKFEGKQNVDGVDGAKSYLRLRRDLTPGEIGCALSHAAVYRKIVNERIEHSIVLEDDAIPSSQFRLLLQKKVLERYPYDLVLLHSRYPFALRWPTHSVKELNLRFYRLIGPPSGAAAYYVRLPAAEKLQKVTSPVSYVADWPAPIHHWTGTRCLHPFTLLTPPPEQDLSTMANWEHLRIKAVDQPQKQWRTRMQRLLGLALLPCLLNPSVFGTLEDQREVLMNLRNSILGKLGCGISLEWQSEGVSLMGD